MTLGFLNRRRLGIAAGLSLLAVGAFFFVTRGPLAPAGVSVTSAARLDLAPDLFGIGVVEARRTILVGPTAAGRVARVWVEQGDRVEAGKLLAEMDPLDLNERLAASRYALSRARSALVSAQAQTMEAESRLTTAEASALRHASLRERGFVSSEAERAKGHEARAAQAALAASRANIESARADAARLAAEASALERQVANTRLTAPVAGLVVSRELEPGSTAVAGQAVLRLAEAGSFWLRVRIDQGRSAGLAVGLPAGIALRSRPAEALAGRVARIERLSDAVTEERVAMVAFDRLPEGLTLNEMAEVTLRLPMRAGVLAVPPAALSRQGGWTGVFVVESGWAKFRAVKTGVRTAAGVEIIEGLAEGETVVTRRSHPISDGDRVRVTSDSAARG